MTGDPNRDLIGRIAHRPDPGEEDYHAYQRANEAPTVYSGDWNVPIDRIQADSMTVTQIIRGEIADAKARAAAWEPRPLTRRQQ